MRLNKITIIFCFLLPINVLSQPLQISMNSFIAFNSTYIKDDRSYAISIDYQLYKSMYFRFAISTFSCKLTTFYGTSNTFTGDYKSLLCDLGISLKYQYSVFYTFFGLGIGYYRNGRSIDQTTQLRYHQLGYLNIEEKLKDTVSPYLYMKMTTPIFKNIFYLVEIKYTLLKISFHRDYTSYDNQKLSLSYAEYLRQLFYGIGIGLNL